jgi:ankyrin repeat protein
MLSIKLIQQCKAGNITAVERLLDENADVNAAIFGSSPLLAAIETNNLDLLDVLLEAGVDIATFTRQSRTALMVATEEGHLDAVNWLLQHQPASLLNARDEHGRTAMYLAIQKDHVDIVSTLYAAGADMSIASNDGTMALTACSNVDVVARLLELGLNIDARYERGMNVLLLACARGDFAMVKMLLPLYIEPEVDLFAQDDTRTTALMHACIGGHTEVMDVLLDVRELNFGARYWDEAEWAEWLNQPRADDEEEGDTALHLAVKGRHVGCVRALINASADVNAPDDNEASPIFYTADLEIARILLEAGAEDIFNGGGGEDLGCVTPGIRACENPHLIDILRLMLQYNFLLDYVHYLSDAVEAGNIEAMEALLEAHPELINKPDTCRDGMTALFFADEEVMAWLLERGADPFVVDEDGGSLLMRHPDPACVRLLLDAAPSLVGVKDLKGWSVLMYFSSYGSYKLLEELFRHCEEHSIDTEINHRDNQGDTALHVAVWNGWLHAVELLLNKGAEVLVSGHDGMTSLMKMLPVSDDTENIVCFPEDPKKKDVDMSACLKLVLDFVLTHGGVSMKAALVDADAVDAEVEVEHAAKRRRMEQE